MTALALAVAAPIAAAPRPREGNVVGVITATSLGTNPATVTISSRTGSVTLNLASSTVIQVGGQVGSTADLQLGAPVHAKFNTTTRTATRIEVRQENAEVFGRVVSVSGDQVGIDTDGDGDADLVFTVTAETRLNLGGATLTLGELGLLQGQLVRVQYTPGTTLVAAAISSTSQGLEGQGTVTAVDAANGTISIQTRSGIVNLNVLQGAQIRLMGRTASLAQVQVGDRVAFRFLQGTDGNVLLALNVLGLRPMKAVGTVTAVDVSGGTVTIADRRGSVVLTVTQETDLRINGRRATLADLAAALDANTGRTVKVNATYFGRAGVNIATDLRVNVNGRGRG